MVSFKDLASMSSEALTALAAKIEVPLERIKRDRWIQKAKKAHFEKYQERL